MHIVNSLLSPLGGGLFFSALSRGLIREGGLNRERGLERDFTVSNVFLQFLSRVLILELHFNDLRTNNNIQALKVLEKLRSSSVNRLFFFPLCGSKANPPLHLQGRKLKHFWEGKG